MIKVFDLTERVQEQQTIWGMAQIIVPAPANEN